MVRSWLIGGTGVWKSAAASSNPRLPSLVRDLAIDYTALSFVAPEKVRFRYKLEGHDRDWTDADTRRQAFYNDLEPRRYRFRVIASNNSGVWNDAGASLDFSIATAYYQTIWFRVSIGAVRERFLLAGILRASVARFQRGAAYQINFSANCIWRDVVPVEVSTPAEEIGAPLAANKLVLLVVTTGDAKLV